MATTTITNLTHSIVEKFNLETLVQVTICADGTKYQKKHKVPIKQI